MTLEEPSTGKSPTSHLPLTAKRVETCASSILFHLPGLPSLVSGLKGWFLSRTKKVYPERPLGTEGTAALPAEEGRALTGSPRWERTATPTEAQGSAW